MKRLFLIVPALPFLFSCGSGEKVDKSVLDAVNESMEIKKVNDADVFNKAMEWGDEISLAAQQELMGKLTRAIEEKGVDGAVEVCNVEALPTLKKVGDTYGVSIRRVSHDYRNPADQPNVDEEMLLKSYEYNEEKGIESKPNLQEIQNGEVLLYTKAIKVSGQLCLKCHGEPYRDIKDETLRKLNELYPQDKAKGHRVGDLRGMWSIAIPKKEVVKKL